MIACARVFRRSPASAVAWNALASRESARKKVRRANRFSARPPDSDRQSISRAQRIDRLDLTYRHRLAAEKSAQLELDHFRRPQCPTPVYNQGFFSAVLQV